MKYSSTAITTTLASSERNNLGHRGIPTLDPDKCHRLSWVAGTTYALAIGGSVFLLDAWVPRLTSTGDVPAIPQDLVDLAPAAITPALFVPSHHDNWLPGLTASTANYDRPLPAELARIASARRPELRTLHDLADYLRPGRLTFTF
ncbi:hypothetical protein OHB12_06375 [Nocardia sp. NBC_01730]|uniref:hypothetical protein n=1 Tax=Nocardia sp. NBC_01730 TaxID=2975998 RepID=UPI002E11B030|nr:hypothetical protein OHB12_06375 [Nocardia sp. NBC_01730]